MSSAVVPRNVGDQNCSQKSFEQNFFLLYSIPIPIPYSLQFVCKSNLGLNQKFLPSPHVFFSGLNLITVENSETNLSPNFFFFLHEKKTESQMLVPSISWSSCTRVRNCWALPKDAFSKKDRISTELNILSPLCHPPIQHSAENCQFAAKISPLCAI